MCLSKLPLEFFELEHLAAAIRDELQLQTESEPTSCLANNRPMTVSDRTLLQRLLPKSEYERRMNAGYRDVFLLTFSLRHQLGRLAMIAHAHVSRCRKSQMWLAHRAAIEEMLLNPLDEVMEQSGHLVLPEYWISSTEPRQYHPSFGASALGCHVVFSRIDRCRAFDAYSASQCTKEVSDLFCSEHAAEAWWIRPERAGSLASQMSLFYASEVNAQHYNEEDLTEMVGKFWRDYSRAVVVETPGEKEIAEALAYFDLADRSALVERGTDGLRRRFLHRARTKHPDTGGSDEGFVTLKKHYDILKATLAG